MSEPPGKAVFLSYASQDAEAARRIADALRGFGMEVWFDQHELRGGDAWDQKIRKQIQECTLFLPVISTTTQERGEGYFRREWKLAADRTNDIAEGVPFIVPVTVDDIPQSTAAVPEPFLRIQWTRLPHGVPTPEFVAQVKRLFESPRTPVSVGTRPGVSGSVLVAPRRRLQLWTAGGAACVVLALVAYFSVRQPVREVTVPKAVVADANPSKEVSVTDKSIAVLPFANLSPDKENEFFADGMHEDILTNLARIRALRVVSRFSVMEYRGKTGNLREIARKLGVNYILEGSVRRSSEQVRVTGQLIRAATDEHIWAEDYTKELTATNVFAIQSDIAKQIAAALHAVISPAEKKLIERRPTRNAAAYDLYLKARESYNSQSGGSSLKANREQAELLQAAVQFDPQFPLAWSQLAYVQSFYYLNFMRTAECLEWARTAVDAAVRLAPEAPETALALGYFHYHAFRDFAKAIEQFERVRMLAPSSPDWSIGLGVVLRRQGRWKDAIDLFRRTVQLDPGNFYIARQLALSYVGGRRYEEALAQWRRLAEALPNDLNVSFELVRTMWHSTGSTEVGDDYFRRLSATQAGSTQGLAMRQRWAYLTGRLAEFQRLESIRPNDWPEEKEFLSVRSLRSALVSAALGHRAEVRARIADFAQLRARVATEPANAVALRALAEAEALAGDASEALRCARKAVELLPMSLDAYAGPSGNRVLAFVYAWTGDKEAAISEYARLLRLPHSSLNIHEMKTSPDFFPLRGDPRFEALLNDPKNNAPLF